MSIKKVLLMGGTGAIGTYLTKILQGKDLEVYVTSRSKHGGGQSTYSLSSL